MLITHPQPSLDVLGKYYESADYISHTDSKRSLFEKAYHFVKGIALKNKLNLINSLQPNKGKILDIGAGTGEFLSVAQQDGWQTTGVEPSEKAKQIAINKGVSFAATIAQLEDHSFDVITMWHVLEHVPDLNQQIKELKRLLKPTGSLIIAVPNLESFDANYYKEYWAAYDVPRHLYHFRKKDIENLAEKGSPTQWTDSMLTFIFYYMGGSVGNWPEVLEQYRNPDVLYLFNREGWPGSMEDLESKQNNAKIIHCWKPYYYPTKEESAYVANTLIDN
jgi:ubiquinone/menaquinone biosynthesis C-methylase UbiE